MASMDPTRPTLTEHKALVNRSFLGAVADEAAMIALTDATRGAVVWREDESAFYQLINDTPATASNWRQAVLLDASGNLDVGSIQIVADTESNLSAVVLDEGQPAYATDEEYLAVGDGSTAFANLPKVPKPLRILTNTGQDWSSTPFDLSDGRDVLIVFDLTSTNAKAWFAYSSNARPGQKVTLFAKECGTANVDVMWMGHPIETLRTAAGSEYAGFGFTGHTTDGTFTTVMCVADDYWIEIDSSDTPFSWYEASGP